MIHHFLANSLVISIRGGFFLLLNFALIFPSIQGSPKKIQCQIQFKKFPRKINTKTSSFPPSYLKKKWKSKTIFPISILSEKFSSFYSSIQSTENFLFGITEKYHNIFYALCKIDTKRLYYKINTEK
jgi:hypothetical protein